MLKFRVKLLEAFFIRNLRMVIANAAVAEITVVLLNWRL
jgi:hypothetical protein